MESLYPPLPPRPARVLVVDDESRIRLALRACLETDGYEVEEAADGDEALDVIRQWFPAAVILDLSMPRLSGARTLRELERLYGRHMPRVIVLTAYASLQADVMAASLGASAFLEKPVLPDALREVVERVLAQAPGAMAPAVATDVAE